MRYWTPYVAIALTVVVAVFFLSWCDAMHEADCRARGGARIVYMVSGDRLCVDAEGRIVR